MVGCEPERVYIAFAKTKPCFQSVCLVRGPRVKMTGVLVGPHHVITAAHGFKKSAQSEASEGFLTMPAQGWSVCFERKSYRVKSVRIPQDYFDRSMLNASFHSGRFDIAILELDEAVQNIEPARFFDEATIPSDPLLYVATYGDFDQHYVLKPTKRAFTLLELDEIHTPGLESMSEKFYSYGSIFFAPDGDMSVPTQFDAEDVYRAKQARRHWLSKGKPPYALPLPGTSGAPVFIALPEGVFLFGIISGHTTISKCALDRPETIVHYMRKTTSWHKVCDRYQALIASFYKKHKDRWVRLPLYRELWWYSISLFDQ